MKVIEEIRLENLLILIEEAGGITRFAEKSGKQQAQISQLVNKSPDSKTKKPKAIGSKQAREFEKVANKETGWLDHDHSDREADLFRQLPAEVREWLIKRGNPGDESSASPEKKLG